MILPMLRARIQKNLSRNNKVDDADIKTQYLPMHLCYLQTSEYNNIHYAYVPAWEPTSHFLSIDKWPLNAYYSMLEDIIGTILP